MFKNAYRGLDFGLGEDAEMLRDSVRSFRITMQLQTITTGARFRSSIRTACQTALWCSRAFSERTTAISRIGWTHEAAPARYSGR